MVPAGNEVVAYATFKRPGIWKRLKGVPIRPRRAATPAFTLAPLDLYELSQAILANLAETLPQRDLAMILREPAADFFRLTAKWGYSDVDLSLLKFPQGSPLIRHFSAQAVPAHYSQLCRTPWFKALSTQERNGLTKLHGGFFVPLSTRTRLMGLLVLGPTKPHASHRESGFPPVTDCFRMASTIEEAWLHNQLKQAHHPSPQPWETDQLRQLEHMARGISHDLNNILTTILSHAQLLEGQGHSGDVREHAAAIRQAVMDGSQSVRQITGITHQPAGPRHDMVEMNDLVKSTLQMIEPRWRRGWVSPSSLVGSRSIRSQIREVPEDRPNPSPPRLFVTLGPPTWISGMPGELRTVLTNVILNAADALPTEHGCIEITTGRDAQWAAIKIRDNGTGISSELIGRIFEPNFTTKGQWGSGMGLHISQRTITHHGGNIQVKSKPRKGSTFTIFLPLADPHGQSTPQQERGREGITPISGC